MADATDTTNPTRRSTLGLFVAAPAAMLAFASGTPIGIDPIHAAIAKHQGLFAWVNEPGTSDEETLRRAIVEDEALFKLAVTEPTSIGGCVALLEYLGNYENGSLGTADVLPNCVETVASALRNIANIA